MELLARTPPMGWNSWDNYGASVTEAEVVATARAMHDRLLPFGWNTVVVDIQWYEPRATGTAYNAFTRLELDNWSRLVPSTNRFPSSREGRGFGPLAKQIHGLGLKFGIHIMRGVPRQAVHADSPILGSKQTARQIAHQSSICAWNTDMYGVDATAPGSQEYYNSLLELYASWGVDFLKVDDILSPYHRGEIDLIRNAIDSCGRDMLLSLSCGPTDLKDASHLRNAADMWRTTGDFWDRWEDLRAAIDTCAAWAPFAGDGRWADADMLPLGWIATRSGPTDGDGRNSRFTTAEQRFLMTLWCVARSPLFLGADLTRLDDATMNLLTNEEVLNVSRNGVNPRERYRANDIVVWSADMTAGATAVGVFNLSNAPRTVQVNVAALGLSGDVSVRDLWLKQDLGQSNTTVVVDMDAHGAQLLAVVPR
jgi:alpha-galactosidase